MIPVDMEARAAWRGIEDPAELFMALWVVASSWEPADRAIAPEPLVATKGLMAAGVACDDPKVAASGIVDAMNQAWPLGGYA